MTATVDERRPAADQPALVPAGGRPTTPTAAAPILLAVAVVGTGLALGLLAGQQGVAALAFGIAAIAAVLAMARPEIATYIVVAILYSNAGAVAVNQHGLPYFIGIAFPLPLVMPLAYHLIVKRRPVVITRAFPLLVLFLIVQLVGAAASRDVRGSVDQIQTYLVGGIGLYFLVTNVIRDVAVLKNVLWVVLFVAAGLGTVSLVQTATGDYSNQFGGFGQVNFPGRGETAPTDDAGGTPRSTGPIGEVNRYAQVMLVLLPIGGLLAIAERGRWRKALAGFLTLLILFGMGSTFSRGAAVGLACVILGLIAFRYLRPQHLLAMVIGAVLVFAAFPRYGERLLDLQAITRLDTGAGGAPVQGDTGNLRSRATESLAAFLAFVDHPLVGVGTGLFPTYYQQYSREVSSAALDTRIDIGDREAHNLYAEQLAETGALGFLCFMGILFVTIRECLRARRRWLERRPEYAHLATGMVLAVVGYMASGLTLHLSFERYFWFLLALAGSTAWVLMRVDPDVAGDPGRQIGSGAAPAVDALRRSPAAR